MNAKKLSDGSIEVVLESVEMDLLKAGTHELYSESLPGCGRFRFSVRDRSLPGRIEPGRRMDDVLVEQAAEVKPDAVTGG